jgi:hypothetical protein
MKKLTQVSNFKLADLLSLLSREQGKFSSLAVFPAKKALQ